MTRDSENKTITITQKTGVTFSIAILIMVGGALITATITFQNLRNQVTENTTRIATNEHRLTVVESDGTSSKVQFAQIQEQLKGIDARLAEIQANQAK